MSYTLMSASISHKKKFHCLPKEKLKNHTLKLSKFSALIQELFLIALSHESIYLLGGRTITEILFIYL